MEPFEPADPIRLCLIEAHGEYPSGEQRVSVPAQSRQTLYELELEAFLDAVEGLRPPDRTLDHELLVKETLLRATGDIAEP